MSVVVAHPGKQYVYETVLAAQEAMLLQAFATSVFVSPGSRGARVRAAVAHRFPHAGFVRSALGRSHPQIDATKVVSFPYWAAAARLTWALPGGTRIEARANRRTDVSIARWLSRQSPPPALVHGFEGGARATFSAARRRGITTVLDVANAHERAKCELLLEGGVAAAAALDTERILAERRLADALVAPSDWVVDCLLEHGVEPTRIVKIPFGADPGRVSPATDRDETFRVLFVGGVCMRKGVRYLLEAWRRLALPNAELVLVGGADTSGESLRAEYGELARFEGQRSAAEVSRWLSVADVFAFPSLAEGSAIVTYEALAAGVPVVTTPNAGSVVRDGIDGIIVPPRDVEGLAAALLKLYDDRTAAREMGARGRAEISARYTWAHYRARVADLYRALLEERA